MAAVNAATAAPVTRAVTPATPACVPTTSDVWLSAAAVAGSRRGVLAKITAVRTHVPTTNPAPTAKNGTMKNKYDVDGESWPSNTSPRPTIGEAAGNQCARAVARKQSAGDRTRDRSAR